MNPEQEMDKLAELIAERAIRKMCEAAVDDPRALVTAQRIVAYQLGQTTNISGGNVIAFPARMTKS